jgi:hypothetical protein
MRSQGTFVGQAVSLMAPYCDEWLGTHGLSRGDVGC